MNNSKDLLFEKDYLKNVRDIVKKELNLAINNSTIKKNEAGSLKKYVWNSINTLNCEIDNLESYFYFNEANKIESVSLFKKDKANIYKKIYKSAYFGRVIFLLNKERENIYIGIANVTKDNDILVYDWRSPVSSLFYNYGRGNAKYEAPIGDINGKVLLKRQYKILNDKILRLIDSDINIDDEYLQEILSSSSDEKMKNIVSTIQIEQNKIIRENLNKSIIVQGIAGSGKTSVAIHRIGYLLYAIKNINSSNFLIFSPNNLFSSYISNILPELGEENILNMEFSSFAKSHLQEIKKIETFSEYLKRIYTKDGNSSSIKFKMSYDSIYKINEFIIKYKKELKFDKGFKLRDIFFSKIELNNLFINKYSSLNILDRIYKISDYICNKLEIKQKKIKKQIFDLLISKLNKNIDIISIYNYFIEDVGNMDKISEDFVNYEDLSLLLFIKFELFGYPYDRNIKYLTIDEGQDYNYIQYVILKKIFKNAYFSIFGDINQTLNFYIEYLSLNDLSTIFEDSSYIKLNKTYRSSKEIMDYTNQILNIKESEVIRKEFNYPVIVRNKKYDINKDIEMLKNKFSSIAIIVKNENSIKIDGFRLITDENKEMSNLSIIPVYLAKGLEFDAVIVYDINYNSILDKKMFYVACTRAHHQLIIYN